MAGPIIKTAPIHSQPLPKISHRDETLTPDLLFDPQNQNPAALSLPRALKYCAKSSALSAGRQLHAAAFKLRLSHDLFVQTSLISMYSSCSDPSLAIQVFDEMVHRTAASFTSAATAFLRSGRPKEALCLLHQMRTSGLAFDSFSLVLVLSACSHLGSLGLGRGAHGLVEKTLGSSGLTVFMATALVDMYCKCGSIEDAANLFDSAPDDAKSVRTWNAMLHGLAMHGLGTEATRLFAEMELVRPNEVTFVALLCGCAHAGLVEEGKFYFGEMRGKYGIHPGVKHYGCMVDLLGRAGLFDEAFELIKNMSVPPNYMIWGALLSACNLHGNVEIAERVMEKIIAGPVEDTSHFVIMSNIYRKAGLSEKMAMMRAMVGKKPKGMSWVEMDGQVTEFWVGGDASRHMMWGEIKEMLDAIHVRVGCGVRGSENPHSEKVALAFGLIRTGQRNVPIRISKNLRICDNCHDLMKSVSDVYKREIVVRDCNRFHRFIGGLCSCKDYW